MIVLGIETSCDETSAAVVSLGKKLLSNVVASQDELHAPYGGIVPEIASRSHIERIEPVVTQALKEAGIKFKNIHGIAVTKGPGLLGSLIVGLSYAKALSYAKGIPLSGIDHLEAHLHAVHLEKEIEYPFIGLLVSGGHTALYEVRGVGDYLLLGTTKDDAAGEAFDKVAKLLGLGYPGGRKIDELSKKGNPSAIHFPRAFLKEEDLGFSFSGLKTAVLNYCKRLGRDLSQQELYDICASFQEAVKDVLIEQALKALELKGMKQLVVAGGVAANSRLRQAFEAFSSEKKVQVYFPVIEERTLFDFLECDRFMPFNQLRLPRDANSSAAVIGTIHFDDHKLVVSSETHVRTQIDNLCQSVV